MKVVCVWLKVVFYKVKRSLQLLFVKTENLDAWSALFSADMKATEKLIKVSSGKVKQYLRDLKSFQKDTFNGICKAIEDNKLYSKKSKKRSKRK